MSRTKAAGTRPAENEKTVDYKLDDDSRELPTTEDLRMPGEPRLCERCGDNYIEYMSGHTCTDCDVELLGLDQEFEITPEYESWLEETMKRSLARKTTTRKHFSSKACLSCGKNDWIEAVDNKGQEYLGCRNCTVVKGV